DLLLLDEPSNHLDRAGRDALGAFLRETRAAVLLASHDRRLLAEVDDILALSRHGARLYGGNYEAYRQQHAAETAAAAAEAQAAAQDLRQTRRKAQAAKERQDRRQSAGTEFWNRQRERYMNN